MVIPPDRVCFAQSMNVSMKYMWGVLVCNEAIPKRRVMGVKPYSI